MIKKILLITLVLTGIAGNAFADSCKWKIKLLVKECCIDKIAYLSNGGYAFVVKVDPKTDKPQHCNY